MIFSRDKAYAPRYERELLLQTDAYTCFVNEYEEDIRGISLSDSPLFVVNDFNPDASAAGYLDLLINKCNELKGNDKAYVVFVSNKGTVADNGVQYLLSECKKAVYPDLIYADEDKLDENNNKRYAPFLKPDYSPQTLLNSNYFGNFFAIGNNCLLNALNEMKETEGEREDYTVDMFNYELLLILDEKKVKVTHVTKILFHGYGAPDEASVYQDYLTHQKSSGMESVRQRAMVRRRMGLKGDESVSIIIPSKDHSEILIKCLNSIADKCLVGSFADGALIKDIIVVDNGSGESHRSATEKYIADFKDRNGLNAHPEIKYIYSPMEFNYSRMCNIGTENAEGLYFLFMNDDIEVTCSDFLSKLLIYANEEEVGAVGIKLLYPESDLIQHIGVTDLLSGPAHMLSHHSDSESLYYGINKITGNCLAVTGACLLVDREKYFQVNGFHDTMKVGYNDVDLCVSLYEKGYKNVCVRDISLYHHESLSRGDDMDDAKFLRLSEERRLYYERHSKIVKGGDPFHHPYLHKDSTDYKIYVSADCDNRYKLSTVTTISHGMKCDKHAHLTIEKAETVRGIGGRAEAFDCLYIEGWALINKHDNRRYDRYLCLIPEDAAGHEISVRVFDKYRSDVGAVFNEARFTELSGFTSRIDVSEIEDNVIYRTAVAFMENGKCKYMAIGGLYATDRGYFS